MLPQTDEGLGTPLGNPGVRIAQGIQQGAFGAGVRPLPEVQSCGPPIPHVAPCQHGKPLLHILRGDALPLCREVICGRDGLQLVNLPVRSDGRYDCHYRFGFRIYRLFVGTLEQDMQECRRGEYDADNRQSPDWHALTCHCSTPSTRGFQQPIMPGADGDCKAVFSLQDLGAVFHSVPPRWH